MELQHFRTFATDSCCHTYHNCCHKQHFVRGFKETKTITDITIIHVWDCMNSLYTLRPLSLSVSMFFCLSHSVPLSLTRSLPLPLSSPFLSLPLSHLLSSFPVFVCASLRVCASVYLSVSLCFYLSVCFSLSWSFDHFFTFFSLSFFQAVHVFFIGLSVGWPCLLVCPFVYLSFCLSDRNINR